MHCLTICLCLWAPLGRALGEATGLNLEEPVGGPVKGPVGGSQDGPFGEPVGDLVVKTEGGAGETVVGTGRQVTYGGELETLLGEEGVSRDRVKEILLAEVR